MTKRKAHSGHDPYNPKDLPVYKRTAEQGDWPAKCGHRQLVMLVRHWYEKHGNYELPPDLVDRAVRYTLAAVRYFVDRERMVDLKGMGRLTYGNITGRKGRSIRTGEVFEVPPHVEPKWRPSRDWVDDLTFAKYGRPRKRKGLHRARQRYYLRKLAEQGLLDPSISDVALHKLGLTRAQLLAAVAERERLAG